jgi:hypothetical protein
MIALIQLFAEPTRILEGRLRVALSTTVARQRSRCRTEGGLALLQSIFGHIRNPSHHKLLGNLSPERTIQLLGMIDYAIYLVETAEKLPE